MREESPYFKILQKHSADIDFVLGKFYNGMTQPAINGVFFGERAPAPHRISAGDIYASVVNGIFDGDAAKVCVSSNPCCQEQYLHCLAMLIDRSAAHPAHMLGCLWVLHLRVLLDFVECQFFGSREDTERLEITQ